MAISLSQYKQAGQQLATSERIAAEYAKQQRKAKKRRGWSGLLGGIGGKLLGGALAGLSGGLLAPLLMAGGMFAGKKIGHELTRGMAADTKGLKADEYGYGKSQAKTLAEGLREQMATDPMKEHGGFGQDVLASYLSAGLEGDMFKKAGDFGTDIKEYGLKDTMARTFGVGGKKFGKDVTKQALIDNLGLEDDFWDLGNIAETATNSSGRSRQYDWNPQFKEGGRVADDVSLAGGKSILDLFQTDSGEYGAEQAFEIMRPEGKRWYLGKGESKAMGLAKEKAMLDAIGKAQFNPADSLVTGGLPINEVLAALSGGKDMEEAPKKKKKFGFFEEGGQVPQYYGGGSVSPTISEYFNKQGKSLGGSNKQSLAEMLGRK